MMGYPRGSNLQAALQKDICDAYVSHIISSTYVLFRFSTAVGPGMLANTALVDFELSMKKPYRLTADSGLDALCHALEA